MTMWKKILLLATGAASLTCLSYCSYLALIRKLLRKPKSTRRFPFRKFATKNHVKFTVLFFNDVYEISPLTDGSGGLAEMASLIKQQRKHADAVFVSLNGDFLSASTLAEKFKGKHMIDTLNAFNEKEKIFDMVCLGNHEFDYGKDVLEERIAESNFEWIGTNVVLTRNPEENLKGVLRKKIITLPNPYGSDIKIGMFGLCTTTSKFISFPGDEIKFLDEIGVAQVMAKGLKNDGCDYIIAITHLVIDFDRELAEKVPDIDLIIGGHDHWVVMQQVKNAMIFKAGQNASKLCRIDIEFSKMKKQVQNVEVETCSSRLEFGMISNTGYHPDPHVQKVINFYLDKLPKDWNEVIAVSLSELNSQTILCRSQESSMTNLLADALKTQYKCDIALVNAGTCRGDKIYPRGTSITAGDVRTEFPFSQPALVRISGFHLKKVFEESLSHVHQGTTGGFPCFSSGMKIEFSRKATVGNRISRCELNGKNIADDEEYLVVTTDYLVNGGDGYITFKEGKRIIRDCDNVPLADHVISYLKETKVVDSVVEGRVVEI